MTFGCVSPKRKAALSSSHYELEIENCELKIIIQPVRMKKKTIKVKKMKLFD